jgi:hypothetical protein
VLSRGGVDAGAGRVPLARKLSLRLFPFEIAPCAAPRCCGEGQGALQEPSLLPLALFLEVHLGPPLANIN